VTVGGGPLAGVRVLDLSTMLSGPFGAMILGDLGAEVIKIETPDGGDGTRRFGPYFVGGESAYFLSINRNKRSLVLNLKLDEGRRVFYDLVRVSDVVFENFRPGVLERLRIDYAALQGINPRIICCGCSGFGSKGPAAERPAFDIVVQAKAGAMSMTGEPDGPPMKLGVAVGDVSGGMYAALGVLAALHHRAATGEGQRVETDMFSATLSWLVPWTGFYLASGEVPRRTGTSHPQNFPFQAYPTQDGHIVFNGHPPKFWSLLCGCMGMPEIEKDPRFATDDARRRNKAALDAVLEARLRTGTTAAWLRLLVEAGVPAGPINSVADALADPQVEANGMLLAMAHPTAGTVRATGNPVRMTAGRTHHEAPPLLGEHTDEVLTKILGYPASEVRRLRDAQVVG
jgi:crotonobetainyl-CoA:carnitine CoA-transferase CaiB-like acyl-CoA transferase